METLIVIERLDKAGAVLERRRFEQFPVSIGRGYGNHLLLDDVHVDASHGEIVLCDDGSLEYRDLGSANGSLLAGKPLRQYRLAADQTLLLGVTRLRLRTAACPVPPVQGLHRHEKQLLHWQPGWLLTLTAALLFGLVSGLLNYLRDFNDPHMSRALGAGLFVLLPLALWAGVWSLVGRLFVSHTAFRAHLTIAATALLLITGLYLLLDPVSALLAGVPGIDDLALVIVLLPAFAGLVAHLRLATHMRQRAAVLRLLGGCAVIGLIAGINTYSSNQSYDSGLQIQTTVEPLPASWLPGATPTQFFDEARDLRQDALDSP
jgi:hypothetical protein